MEESNEMKMRHRLKRKQRDRWEWIPLSDGLRHPPKRLHYIEFGKPLVS